MKSLVFQSPSLRWIAWCLLCMATAACAPAVPSQTTTATLTREPRLTPYLSPTLVATFTPEPLPTEPFEALPSPTPFVHQVEEGDTLLGIALQYGLTVDDLLAANPGLDPRLLSIGTAVVIPLGDEGSAVLPSPEPLPLALADPACYRTANSDRWCFVLLKNITAEPVESGTVQISLFNLEGDLLDTYTAPTILNVIPAGEQLPTVAFYRGPLADDVLAKADLLSAFPAVNLDTRYASLVMDDPEISISSEGKSARILGTLRLRKNSLPAGSVRVAAAAYDASGEIVGVRVWEAAEGLEADETINYTFEIYSLGAEIERVEVFSEARP